MNRLYHTLLLLLFTLVAMGQSHQEKYGYYMQMGQEQFDAANYREANQLFKAAEISTKDPNLQRKALSMVMLSDERYVEALQLARDAAEKSRQEALALLGRAQEAEKHAERQARLSQALYIAFIADQEIVSNENEGHDKMDTLAMQLAFDAKHKVSGDTGFVESIDGVFGHAAYMATRRSIPRHGAGVSRIWVNPDDSFISVGRDSVMVAQGYEETTSANIINHDALIQEAQVYKNGAVVVTVTSSLSQVTIWYDIAHGKSYKQYTFAPHHIYKVLYDPNERYLCVAVEDNGLHFINTDTDFTKKVTEGGRSVRDIRFSPDSAKVVSRGENGIVGIWRVNGDRIAVFKAHDKYVYGATFSHSGQQILTNSADHTARLWSLDGNLLASLVQHKDPVFHAEYSPDGQQILTYTTGGDACIWSNEGRLISSVLKDVIQIEHAMFHPDNQSVLAVSGLNVHQVNRIDGVKMRSFDNNVPIVGIAISPDGRSLLTWGHGASVKVWDLNTGSYMQTETQGHRLMDIALKNGADVTLAKFSPDSKHVYVGMADGVIQIVPMPQVTYEMIREYPFAIPQEYLEQHNISLKED